jgi:glycosyltransferase involved in cell wall biosynthesis
MGPTVREAGMGFVVEPESADRLREAIEKFLLLTPEDRLQMEAKSRAVATALSWNSICVQLEDIYSEILKRKRGGAL